MELVLSAPALAQPGGVQSYLLTIAPQLERLGHEVHLFAPIQGEAAEFARSRGMRVAGSEDELPARCDALVANDAPTLLDLTERYPEARRMLVVHGAELDVHLPPALDGLVHVAVAMNDAVRDRLAATALAPPTVRLTQPVDPFRFRETPAAETPRRVLLLGNYLEQERREAFLGVCAEAGLEVVTIGAHVRADPDPTAALRAADVVVGVGRSVLEAMASGRAAWVFAGASGDGWLTPEAYPLLETDGFRGWATPRLVDAEAFRGDLAAYSPELGRRGRELVLLHHLPEPHAAALVGALGDVRPTPPPDAPLRDHARLIRVKYEVEVRAGQLGRDLAEERRRNLHLLRELEATQRRLDDLVHSRRWQTAQRLGRSLDAA